MGWTNPKKTENCKACGGKGSTAGLLGQTRLTCKACGGKGKVEK